MAVNNRSATKKGRKVVVVKKNAEKGVRKRSESVARHFRLALNFLDDALDVGRVFPGPPVAIARHARATDTPFFFGPGLVGRFSQTQPEA
jgi:hypothetical protein